MDNIIPNNEYTEVEGRAYLNPQTALDESNAFIDNLRSTQTKQNQQIAQDTFNLGSNLPSAQGGLGTNNANNMSYFTSRYQTPQTASAVADLRTTAQAAALNQVLANQQAMWQKRYNDAYRSYQKSAYDKSNSGKSGGGSSGGSGTDTIDGNEVIDKPTGLSAAEGITLDLNSSEDTGKGVTWTIEMGSVGNGQTVWHRIDSTKPLDDPERDVLYIQQADGTLVRK